MPQCRRRLSSSVRWSSPRVSIAGSTATEPCAQPDSTKRPDPGRNSHPAIASSSTRATSHAGAPMTAASRPTICSVTGDARTLEVVEALAPVAPLVVRKDQKAARSAGRAGAQRHHCADAFDMLCTRDRHAAMLRVWSAVATVVAVLSAGSPRGRVVERDERGFDALANERPSPRSLSAITKVLGAAAAGDGRAR